MSKSRLEILVGLFEPKKFYQENIPNIPKSVQGISLEPDWDIYDRKQVFESVLTKVIPDYPIEIKASTSDYAGFLVLIDLQGEDKGKIIEKIKGSKYFTVFDKTF